MAKPRSLADELADLVNPAPRKEFDPEALEGAEEGQDIGGTHDGDLYVERAACRSKRRAKESGLRLRAAVQLNDEAYRGRTTSAAKVFEDDFSLPQQLLQANGHESGSDNGEGKRRSGSEEGSEGFEASGTEQEGGESDDNSDQDGDEVMGDEDVSEEDGDDGSGYLKKLASANPELQQLEAQYEQLAAEDAAVLVTLRQRTARELEKGAAVKRQRLLYDRSLETRILLQKCLAGGNQMPPPTTRQLALAHAPQLAQPYSDLAAAAQSTLLQLLELQGALLTNNPGIAAASSQDTEAVSSSLKRSRDEFEGEASCEAAWKLVEAHDRVFAPFRDSAIDRWHRRTVLSAGSAALRNNLRALNQSISAQVAAIMRDSSKFIKRTRYTLSSRPQVLCEPQLSCAPAEAPAQPGSSTVALAPTDDADEPRDAETYDDSDFYSHLLKEFLDGSAGGASKAATMTSAKNRKKVDRRASKGRKIRYSVQEKLVNFTVPVQLEPPPFATQLFANLFGAHAAAAR